MRKSIDAKQFEQAINIFILLAKSFGGPAGWSSATSGLERLLTLPGGLDEYRCRLESIREIALNGSGLKLCHCWVKAVDGFVPHLYIGGDHARLYPDFTKAASAVLKGLGLQPEHA